MPTGWTRMPPGTYSLPMRIEPVYDPTTRKELTEADKQVYQRNGTPVILSLISRKLHMLVEGNPVPIPTSSASGASGASSASHHHVFAQHNTEDNAMIVNRITNGYTKPIFDAQRKELTSNGISVAIRMGTPLYATNGLQVWPEPDRSASSSSVQRLDDRASQRLDDRASQRSDDGAMRRLDDIARHRANDGASPRSDDGALHRANDGASQRLAEKNIIARSFDIGSQANAAAIASAALRAQTIFEDAQRAAAQRAAAQPTFNRCTEQEKLDISKIDEDITSLLKIINERTRGHETIPDDYLCPISHQLMRNPVILKNTSYEQCYIEEWLSSHNTNPITNDVLANEDKILTPNNALKTGISKYKQHLISTYLTNPITLSERSPGESPRGKSSRGKSSRGKSPRGKSPGGKSPRGNSSKLPEEVALSEKVALPPKRALSVRQLLGGLRKKYKKKSYKKTRLRKNKRSRKQYFNK